MTRQEHEIVLVGAGNSHLQVVRRWAMEPLPGVSLTLVNDALRIPYTGMLPGCIGGMYARRDIEIDVARLCAAAGVRCIHAQADRVAHQDRLVYLVDRPPIRYDLLSLNIGSQPARPVSDGPPALPLKPLHGALDHVDALEERIRATREAFPIVVVGGGAAGFEISLALRRRFADRPQVSVDLVTSGARLLDGATEAVSRHCEGALAERGVRLRAASRVAGADAQSLHLDGGETVPCVACVWTTGAEPMELIAQSGFETDKRGFLKAYDTLQSVTDPAIFATGDCVSLASYPDLPKAGVFAVREGPVLWENLRASVAGEALRAYRPQRLYLFLLNTNDGSAVVNYGPFAGRGAWALRWKSFIDRRWMRKFHNAYDGRMPAGTEPSDEMRCGGCGGKLGRAALGRVLERLDIGSHPDVIVGCRPGDDAAVLRTPPGKVQLQTTDFFKAFIDDPYIFGQIAATNALSDIHAMNGKPASALALVTIPDASSRIRENQLFQVLSGALDTFRAHDVVLAGGHTSESMDFQVGFTVTGYADEDALFRKEGLRPGEQLILTKPLGTGALLRAAMMGRCEASDWQAVLDGMRLSNAAAADVFAAHGVKACTDVTGFGLAGHLLEMLDASAVSARIMTDRVPLYFGFERIAVPAHGEPILSTLHEENARSSDRVVSENGLPPAWLFDPQTSGGLLAGVAADKVAAVLVALRDAGCVHSAHVGKVVARDGKAEAIVLT